MLPAAHRPLERVAQPLRRALLRIAAALGLTLLPAFSPAQQPQPFAALAQSTKTAVLQGRDGWLFLTAELRLLSTQEFWGPKAASVSKSTNPDWADPLPAILDFHSQLKNRGIQLILVPVPPKAAIFTDKISTSDGTPLPSPDAPVGNLVQFHAILQKQGVQTLDLSPLLIENRHTPRGPSYCATDSHWSGNACVLAAQSIAKLVAPVLPPPSRNPHTSEWRSASFRGDLLELGGTPAANPAGQETLPVRQIFAQNSSQVAPDPESPLLLIGDSHTLVFHDFLAENAGLLDQLAFETGITPDLIGTRGSGATPVRISMLRRSVKDPAFLSKKKVVVWCFSAREFTEAESGWQKVAIAR